MTQPFLLEADNFTPPTRTPWGGQRILGWKVDVPLAAEKAAYSAVGESWEISVEPDFPSTLAGGKGSLAQAIARDPRTLLGPAAAPLGNTSLLVKLLDAADPLSVQIHPNDDYPKLTPGQSGKPEAWYIVERDPGAGIYLGLGRGVTRAQMNEALEQGQDVSKLLHFVRVEPGDFFLIEAGTPHAVGAGVALVEPQRVMPGKRGITYRYWDWNRRYDPAGQPDPKGKPRPLHVERALEVTRWEAPREQDLLERIALQHRKVNVQDGARLAQLAGEARPSGCAAVRSEALRVWELAGTGRCALEAAPYLRGLTVVRGSVRLTGDGYQVSIPAGRSAVLPAALPTIDAELKTAQALITATQTDMRSTR